LRKIALYISAMHSPRSGFKRESVRLLWNSNAFLENKGSQDAKSYQPPVRPSSATCSKMSLYLAPTNVRDGQPCCEKHDQRVHQVVAGAGTPRRITESTTLVRCASEPLPEATVLALYARNQHTGALARARVQKRKHTQNSSPLWHPRRQPTIARETHTQNAPPPSYTVRLPLGVTPRVKDEERGILKWRATWRYATRTRSSTTGGADVGRGCYCRR